MEGERHTELRAGLKRPNHRGRQRTLHGAEKIAGASVGSDTPASSSSSSTQRDTAAVAVAVGVDRSGETGIEKMHRVHAQTDTQHLTSHTDTHTGTQHAKSAQCSTAHCSLSTIHCHIPPTCSTSPHPCNSHCPLYLKRPAAHRASLHSAAADCVLQVGVASNDVTASALSEPPVEPQQSCRYSVRVTAAVNVSSAQ